jgi:hypothetical protein|tara:strand:+ start:372 stop:1172 length:801 start_codon:yes stop_codon:yes gene_type:complete
MPFPTLAPTSRTFEAGDYPIKTFTSQNGVETRIIYGSRRTGQKMSLTYQNIFDHQAEEFIDHYDEVFGTLNPFSIASVGTADGAKTGWNGVGTGPRISTGGYTVTVKPASLVAGDTFSVDFKNPSKPSGTFYWRVTGVSASDFDTLIGTSPISLTGTTGLTGTAVSATNNKLKDTLSFQTAVMKVALYATSANQQAQTNALASQEVPITAVPTIFTGTATPKASTNTIDAGSYSAGWRYEGPPQLTQVRPGVSTVTVNLIGVLGAS